MDEENKVPEIGTPEYDEHMLKAHQDNENKFKEPEAPTLPEGVTLEDLLALHKEHSEKDEEELPKGGEEEQQGDEEEKPKGDEEEKPKGDEDTSELTELQAKVKELEDAAATKAVHEAAGGEEAYAQLRENAEKSLDETQLGLLNMALIDGTTAQAVAAVSMMRMLAASNPDAPNQEGIFLTGEKSVQSNSYASEAEFHAALANPLYKQHTAAGEAYREQVQNKLSRSRI